MDKDLIDQHFSTALIKLLQGPVFVEEKDVWYTLLNHFGGINRYFQKIGLELFLDEAEGYGFLRTMRKGSDSTEPDDLPSAQMESQPEDQLPRLIRRQPLTYDLTLLFVLLREALEQYDVSNSDDHRLILSRQDIFTLLQPYFPDRTDQTKQQRRFESLINKSIQFGVLTELKDDPENLEVRRIIKAIVNAEVLEDIKVKLREFSNIMVRNPS